MSFIRPTLSELRAAIDQYHLERLHQRRYRFLERGHAAVARRERTQDEIILRTATGQNSTGDGSLTIQGHAAVTGQEVVLFDLGWLRVREVIDSGAFNAVLASPDLDVHMNVNHDMKFAMARTGIAGVGGLELSMDGIGLADFARVDPAISFVNDLALRMRPDANGRAVIDQQSFAFTIAKETYTETDDGDVIDVLYNVQEIGQLFDVCVCAQGAYPTTDASLRGLMQAVTRRAGIDPAGATESVEGVALVLDREPVEPLAGGESNARELAIAKAAAGRSLHPVLQETA